MSAVGGGETSACVCVGSCVCVCVCVCSVCVSVCVQFVFRVYFGIHDFRKGGFYPGPE